MGLKLKNNTILLRALEPEDLEFLYSCENNTEVWHVSNTLVPYSKFVLKQYLENAHLDIYTAKQLRLIIAPVEKTNEPIGAIDLFDFDPYHQRAGIGILINQKADRKKGFAKAALELLIPYCFDHLNLHQLYCNIADDNKKSIKLFKKAGFKECGVKKDWLRTADGYMDERVYQLINPKS